MDNLDEVWEKACRIFPVLKNNLDVETPCTQEEFEFVKTELNKINLIEEVYELIFVKITKFLRQKIVPEFWKFFENLNEKSDSTLKDDFHNFQYAVHKLHSEYEKFQIIVKRLTLFKEDYNFQKSIYKNRNDFVEFDKLLRSALLAGLPPDFNAVVYSFYSTSFKILTNSISEDSDPDYSFVEDLIARVKCNGCGKSHEECECQKLIAAFNETNEYLGKMKLLDRLAGFTLTKLIEEKISDHVQATCKGIFDVAHLENLEKWLDTCVLNWLMKIFNEGNLQTDNPDNSSIEVKKVLRDFKVKLVYFLYETYAKIIIDQFFNIIIDYPDSQPAIDDLKYCLEKIDLRKHLIKTIKKSLEVRLLHPGVNTMDILTGYVAAIKAIRHLDSSGVILETVIEPVKDYLRKRSDTVRCVVTGLTEEGPTDLAEELARSEILKENLNANKDEEPDWMLWKPDPIDADISLKSKQNNRTADIISMVVDIYGSKELFVNEYRNLLADRLLVQLDFNPEREIRNLELLKLRFGESLLHSCEVMLKDISDSKRINTHIQSDIKYNEGKSFEISSLILSSQFWPNFNKETLELPEEVESEFKKYTTSYEAYKGNRTLNWRPVTGRVNIEIQLTNRTLDMTVTPTQAIIIYHFQNKNEWTLDELSKTMNVPQSILRKKILFWHTQGLIKETDTDVYKLVDEKEGTKLDEMQTREICEDDESESAMASASDQREEELQVFWSYIVGMLTNLDSLPIERIHQMLKMFASHGPGVEFTQEELKNFLQRKVREHRLTYVGGVYQLMK